MESPPSFSPLASSRDGVEGVGKWEKSMSFPHSTTLHPHDMRLEGQNEGLDQDTMVIFVISPHPNP